MTTGTKMERARTAPETNDVISSRDNRWLKEFRLALRGGLATERGCVGVEGVRLVEEALGSGCRVETVLFSESGERHRERLAPLIRRREMGFPILKTSDRLFEGIADTEHPQGVAALIEPRNVEIADLLATREGACSPLLVVLAGVQDPGNVGTILDGSGVWRHGSGNIGDRAGWDRQSIFSEGAQGFGGSGAPFTGAGGDVAHNFADATEGEWDSYTGLLCPR